MADTHRSELSKAAELARDYSGCLTFSTNTAYRPFPVTFKPGLRRAPLEVYPIIGVSKPELNKPGRELAYFIRWAKAGLIKPNPASNYSMGVCRLQHDRC
eukprot:scaffold239736_cov33-Prasinocladus_malaysianus.AAC.1